MSQNYEKQLQYYSMYSGKYNIKDLKISESKEKSFNFFPDKRKSFLREVNKIKGESINNNNETERIQKILNKKKI